MIFLSKNILFLKKFGLTAYKIEKETGIPQSTISYIIHSKNNNIELKSLEKLFCYYKKNLNLKLEDLLFTDIEKELNL